jgi:hypothetical protein
MASEDDRDRGNAFGREIRRERGEVRVTPQPDFLPSEFDISVDIKGEATAVEVTPGRYLFALLDRVAGRPEMSFFDDLSGDPKERWKKLETMSGSAPLPRKEWPRLVTFGDLNEPKSVSLVDPDDLALVFGPGVRLKSIIIEMTNEPVGEFRLLALLPWLEIGVTKQLGPGTGRATNIPFYRRVAYASFVQDE